MGAPWLKDEDFDRRYIPEPNSGCWLWLGQIDRCGYRIFGTRGRAHRFSYKKHHGPIPSHLEIDHLCRMPCCVNPAHLECVTHAENIARAPTAEPNRKRSLTHCKNGHEFTEENTNRYATMNYRRQCKLCSRERALKRAERLRAQNRR